MKDFTGANQGKFVDPKTTAKGEDRATVSLSNPKTLWFNTGTLCNIECVNCYIDSSPTNDALVYLTEQDVASYVGQVFDRKWPITEIAFTGGEPFMNPNMIDMARVGLDAGFDVLILTNAMRPMMRPKMLAGLKQLNEAFPGKLTLRISVDHYTPALHDEERGAGSFEKTRTGMNWLRDHGIAMAVAGRTVWAETQADAREGFDAFFKANGYDIDAFNPATTVLFPEMDESVEVPEITTECWGILNKSPQDIMCASSRMVVRRKGAESTTVLACTLLAYDPQFELGETLAEAEKDVALNHAHCAKFCVLGGASCSA